MATTVRGAAVALTSSLTLVTATLAAVPAHAAPISATGTQPLAASGAALGGARAILSRMSLAQRVGQLFMVGTPATGASSVTLNAIADRHVGNIMLTGRSYGGTTVPAQTAAAAQARATRAATAGVPLFVATDQEGGYVQVLQGSGISAIPTALTQGSWSTTSLRGAAKTWGQQLRASGVNLNLAPVMDTVPSAAAAKTNPPIGVYQREFGYTTSTVASHGDAFLQGMHDAGVATSVKHFPGLGRVTANTDVSSGVTDTVTTRSDPYLAPFAAGIQAGSDVVMMSTAYYSRIDPSHPAAFSPTVLGSMLRGDLGFHGVVISDDLGNAKQVAAWSPGARATSFLAAGGDMVLTVNPDLLPAMYDAVLAQAQNSPPLAAQVNAAALRVLQVKQRRGLIPAPATAGDYNGDGRSDFGVFRPSEGHWYVLGVLSVAYGLVGDVPVGADYDGDGRTDVAVWRPSTGQWFVRGRAPVIYGRAGDIPVPGEFAGDGRAHLAVWRPSTGQWFVIGRAPVTYGRSGDVPLVGDFTGDGLADVAVWRPSTGQWFIRGRSPVVYGRAGDIPVPGDFAGDGRAHLAVWRPSTGQWFVIGRAPVTYGRSGDAPLVGDFTGDGIAEPAVWRPSTGQWFVVGRAPVTYGRSGDVPVVNPR